MEKGVQIRHCAPFFMFLQGQLNIKKQESDKNESGRCFS